MGDNILDRLTKASNFALPKDSSEFYRKIFYQCCSWITQSSKGVLVLLGVRKCGKSRCLLQIKDKFKIDKIYDFKGLPEDVANKYLTRIVDCKDGIILIDEATYIPNLYNSLHRIEQSILQYPNKKVIITGSQCYNLRYIVNASIGSCADFIYTSFIDFEEWLVFRKKINSYGEEYCPTEEDVKDYIFNQNDFTKINSNIDYIQSCIGETVESEIKTGIKVNGSVPVSNGDEDVMKYVMYMSMFSLHKRRSANRLSEYYKDILAIRSSSDARETIKESELLRRAEDRLNSLIIRNVKPTADEIRDAVLFLHQLGLVTIVEITNDLDSFEVESFLRTYDSRGLSNKKRFFEICNICPKHPMFFMNMLYEVLYDVSKENIQSFVGNDLLGSIYECLVRGLLSYKNFSDFQYEYFNTEPTIVEVDYIDKYAKLAIEFTVSSNHNKNGFESLENYEKIITTSNKEDVGYADIKKVFYPKYLLDLSRGNFVSRITTVPWT